MDNKLSELSKPAAWVTMQPEFCDEERTVITNHIEAEKYNLECYDLDQLYSQEYVSALLSDSEAKDKRIAELERVVAAAKCDDELWDAMAHRLKTLEDKLATPVRLPDPYQTSCGADELYLCPVEVADAIRAAGLTVEGDE